MCNPEVEIIPSTVEGNVTLEIKMDSGTITIHLHNDVTQSIHILADKNIGVSLNNNEYTYDGEYLKRFYKTLEKVKRDAKLNLSKMEND